MNFIIRRKFWIGLGAVTLLALILFVIGPLSAMGQNDERFSVLEDRAEDLQKYASERVKNPQWREQQKTLQRSMEKQLRQIQEELLSRDALLEKHLEDPETGSPGPLSFGRFRTAYDQKMSQLDESLRQSVIEIHSERPLVHVDLGTDWQPQSVLHKYEKQVWIQEAVVNAVADVNSGAAVVPVFISLEFGDEPLRLLADAHREGFDTIPFRLQVAMEFEFYPLFLQHLMETPLGFEITSTSLQRYEGGQQRESARSRDPERRPAGGPRERPGAYLGEGPPGRPEFLDPEYQFREGRPYGPESLPPQRDREQREEDEEKAEPLPSDLVRVHIRGYVPDYLQPGEEASDADAEASRVGPGAPRYGPNY